MFIELSKDPNDTFSSKMLLRMKGHNNAMREIFIVRTENGRVHFDIQTAYSQASYCIDHEEQIQLVEFLSSVIDAEKNREVSI